MLWWHMQVPSVRGALTLEGRTQDGGECVVSAPPGEEVPAVLLPVILHDVLHALLAGGQDGQPGQDSPQPVLLTDVVRACREPQHKHVSHLFSCKSLCYGPTLSSPSNWQLYRHTNGSYSMSLIPAVLLKRFKISSAFSYGPNKTFSLF